MRLGDSYCALRAARAVWRRRAPDTPGLVRAVLRPGHHHHRRRCSSGSDHRTHTPPAASLLQLLLASMAAEQPTPQRARFLRAASTPSLHAAVPPLQHRWLHAADAKASSWAAFGARDDRVLQRGWERSAEERKAWAESKDKDAAQPAPDPDRALESWRVPVAEDRLYEVDLRKLQVRGGPGMQQCGRRLEGHAAGRRCAAATPMPRAMCDRAGRAAAVTTTAQATLVVAWLRTAVASAMPTTSAPPLIALRRSSHPSSGRARRRLCVAAPGSSTPASSRR
jgi:hypothetical protein